VSWGWSNTPSELTLPQTDPCRTQTLMGPTGGRGFREPPGRTHRPGLEPFHCRLRFASSNSIDRSTGGSGLHPSPGCALGLYSSCMSLSSRPTCLSKCIGVLGRSSKMLSSTRCHSWQSIPLSHGSSWFRIDRDVPWIPSWLLACGGEVVLSIAARSAAKKRNNAPAALREFYPRDSKVQVSS